VTHKVPGPIQKSIDDGNQKTEGSNVFMEKSELTGVFFEMNTVRSKGLTTSSILPRDVS
jgi:hypothetical protein